MKKFLLIIFLFFCCINVYAEERTFAGSEYIQNVYYMKNNGEIQQYRKAQVIRDVVTGEIAYCVQPFWLLVDNSNYTYGTGNYEEAFGFNEAAWDRIKLFSYYGYGYKNHTGKEWISITQMSIWRSLFPDYQFDWIDDTVSRRIVSPFNKELEELYRLVNSHYTLPNFKSEYVLSINDTTVLTDSNNVLSEYTIKSSDFNVNLSNNNLEIKTDGNIKEGKIVLERANQTFPETVKYFYSSESQNVIERGNITPVVFELKVKVQEGKIKVNKVDSETKDTKSQGEGELNGAVFELLDSNKNVIKEMTIENNTLEFDHLSFGKYFIREKSAGIGYYLNQKLYEINIDENNTEPEIEIDNQVIKSRVKIIKLFGTKEDYENNTMKRENGISFIIKDVKH